VTGEEFSLPDVDSIIRYATEVHKVSFNLADDVYTFPYMELVESEAPVIEGLDSTDEKVKGDALVKLMDESAYRMVAKGFQSCGGCLQKETWDKIPYRARNLIAVRILGISNTKAQNFCNGPQTAPKQ